MLSGWKEITYALPWLALASFFLVGILVGKSMCGWVCPFGFIQDLVGFIKQKKTEFSPRSHGNAAYMKYAILGITLFVSVTFSITKTIGGAQSYQNALGIFTTAPFTALSPAETLFATVPRMVFDFRSEVVAGKPLLDVLSGVSSLPPLFWIQFAVMVGVLVLVAYVPRGWCRYVCPHGAIMAIMNKFSFLGLRRDLVGCAKGECRKCVEVCPMRVPILDLPWEKFSHEECIYCMKCVDACENKAIKLKYP
jgi:polyferredoxin